MGIPTTTDDRGYLLWLADNWSVFVVPTLILCASLAAWVIRKARGTSGRTPGPLDQPSAPSEAIDLAERPPPVPGADPEPDIYLPFGLGDYCHSGSGL